MMQWSDVNHAPSSRALRHFAGVWLVVFAGLAGWHGLWGQRPVLGLWLSGLALAVGLPGAVSPQTIRPVFVAARMVTFPLGWIVSQFLLAILFYGVFAPCGLVFRLLGRDVLHRQRAPDKATYWTAKPAATDVRGYFRQF
jgi:hypothetical protein